MLGLLFEEAIKAVLFKPVPVAIALVVGGVIILWAERRKHAERMQSVDQLTAIDALKLGDVPGAGADPGHQPLGRDHHRRLAVRPVATHRGGVLVLRRASRCCWRPPRYEIWKARAELRGRRQSTPLIVSCVVSFISALLATKFLLRCVSRHSFAAFAWYRIVFGAVILITAWTGLVHW